MSAIQQMLAAGGVEDRAVALTATTQSPDNGTSYDFGWQYLGPPSADKTVVITVVTGLASPPTSVTVNGSAAVILNNTTWGTFPGVWMYKLQVDSVTANAVIVVNNSSPAGACAIAIYALTGFGGAINRPVTATSDRKAASITLTPSTASSSGEYIIWAAALGRSASITSDMDMSIPSTSLISSVRYTGGYQMATGNTFSGSVTGAGTSLATLNVVMASFY